eukprot:363418-Chlamydomonas_euryale.AAC.12
MDKRTYTLQTVVLSWPSSRRILAQNGQSNKRSRPERLRRPGASQASYGHPANVLRTSLCWDVDGMQPGRVG